MKKLINKIFSIFAVLMIAVSTATAQTSSTITVSDTDYTLFTGFTATDGAEPFDNSAYVYGNAVDGNTSTSFHTSASPAYVEFNTDDPIIPKGYIFNTFMEGYFYPHAWVLKAKANTTDGWTTLSSYSGQTLSSGQEFRYACSNDDNTAYKYFRFEASNSNNNIWLTEIRLYGFENLNYTHLTVKAATCTEVGIMQECYKRGDGKYFTDETGTTELAESAVIEPMIAHTGVHHEADADHIEYWQCSVCRKYFRDGNCTTEIIKAQTFIVKYLDDNGALTTLNSDATMVSSTTTSWTDGWYIVYDDMTIADRISASGTVNLILGNGATLTAVEGITVGSDATLNIYAQTDDEVTMGALVASAAKESKNAAIGGVPQTNFGVIVINGGKITATTNRNCGAPIGGGYKSNGGSITINGGIVSATAGNSSSSAGFGGGNSGFVTSVTLNGGIITATGDAMDFCAGIGTGALARSGTMTITIGSGIKKLVATRGYNSDCIGKAQNALTTVNVVFKNGETTVTGDAKDVVFYDTGEGSQRQVRAKGMNHTVTMSDDLKANITVSTEYAFTGETVTLTLGTTVDATTLNVKNGTNDLTLTDAGNRQYTFTMPDGDVTVTASYTITIADGIEHGTLTVAATAKYMETVTVTATPAFGYRFVRLVVKDAQNNDVASTNNTFQMPKGGAIVSAVFEQGVHGTTEFTFSTIEPHPSDDDCKTIYDGVTTVSIQTGRSYYIQKKVEYSELGFLLDNNVYADIPYAGGTGEFVRNDQTPFCIPYNGETGSGYYDITLTDAGNGKWNVSILSTAAQMDVVSDQTYTGSAITPEPLVVAGSLSLTKDIDYTYSYTNNINAGTATVRATFQGTYAWLGYVEKEFTIAKATPTITAPTAAELTYTGSAQALVKSGTTDHGTLLYSLDGTTYSAEIPTATDAAEYMVYYKVDEQNYYAEGGNVKATIAPKVTTLGALKITENQDGKSAVIDGNYNETSVAYTLESNIENVTVTFNRTFTNDATSTIVLPFGIEKGGYSGGDFFEFTDMDTKTWTATMSKVTSVKAHTPYLFVPSGETLTISQKVKLEATSSTTVASDAKNGWTFTGVYQKKVWDGNDGENKDYCFAANTTSDGVSPGDFVKIGTYVQVRAFRCYLTNSTLSKSKTDLPEKITIRLVDETSAVVTPDDPDPLNPDDSGDITTPVSEIAPNIGTKVWSYDRTIFIEAQSGTDYQIFDLSGRTLLSGATNSTREEITLGRATGIVIVKINGKSFKVNY